MHSWNIQWWYGPLQKDQVMFQASGVIYQTIPMRKHKILSFRREFHLLSKSSSVQWEVSAKRSNVKSNTGLLQMNLLQNTTFTSSNWWGHEEVSSTLQSRHTLEDSHSVLKLCWSSPNAEMLSLISSLQSHPGNLGKFSRTTAKAASQKPEWQKENRICWEYSVVPGTQPTHKPGETVNGNNKNEIKLTIPIIGPISTLHGSTAAF